jgi:hypothetical protein
MYITTRLALISAICLTLTACGGGGSSTTPTTEIPTTPNSTTQTPSAENLTTQTSTPALLLSPSPLLATLYEGESQKLNLKAVVNTTTLDGSVFVLVIDNSGVIDPSILLTLESPDHYNAVLTTKASLTLGTHTGNLDILLCRDSACNQQYPGSPVKAPYTFTVTSPPASFTANPAAITLVQDVDDTLKSVVQIQVADRIPSNFIPKITTTGDVKLTPLLSATSDAHKFSIELSVPSGLTTGTHTGTVNVVLCKDASCTTTYAGSPQTIPYTIKINPIVNLTALTPVSGATDWETFQGNAAHTGYVPMTIDPAKINRRWSWIKPVSDTSNLTTVAASQGRVSVVSSSYFANSRLYSISENNAGILWNYDFGSTFAVNPPAVSGDKVYVASSGHEATAMWQFDAATGKQLFKTPFSSQWEHYLAPTVKNGKVYTDGGSYGGVNSFNIADGALSWFQQLNQYDMWTPAVDTNNVYAYTGNKFSVLSVKDGSIIFEIPDPTFNWNGYSINSAPVIGSLGDVLVVNGAGNDYLKSNNILSYNIAKQNVNWTLAGQFTSIAVASSVAYATNGSPFRLEAHNEGDGALKWSWTPDTATTKFVGNIVATANLIFVGTDTGTYAIDKGTHVPVWHFKKSGNLAITSNGVLLVTDASTIYAINLK